MKAAKEAAIYRRLGDAPVDKSVGLIQQALYKADLIREINRIKAMQAMEWRENGNE